MTIIDTMTAAYLEAIYFTETGDTDQPDSDAEVDPLTRAQAYLDCRSFLWAIGACGGGEEPVEGVDKLNPTQLGHDLWLTRNGHGTGFWDRPEIYGEQNALLFTRLAKAMGEHNAEFIEEKTT